MTARLLHPRRALGASFAVAIGVGSSLALAQGAPPPPPPPPPVAQTPLPPPPAAQEPPPPVAVMPASEPIRFTLDLHAGLLFRLGDIGSTETSPIARGGGLLGLDALIGPNQWFAVGAGYDRAFLGRERHDEGAGLFTETNRTLDELWALGRFYPWQNENVALWLQLGLGPVWQTVHQAGSRVDVSASGRVSNVSVQCSGHGSAGLGLRGGAGVDVTLNSLIMFVADAGVDHFRMSGDAIDACANGAGPSTFLTTRVGFALGTGRKKPAPPPPAIVKPSDRDNDAILDQDDACPDQPGIANADPRKNGCPPPADRDHDGIPDEVDACPDQPGVADPDPKKNGCPADRDGDKIPDLQDACPDVVGIATSDPATNGCPPDTDGDGIRDDKDACPNDKGLPNEDPTKNGCPLVIFTDKEIVIGEQVQFEVDKAVIRPASNGLLDTIATVIKAHPEIKKLEVQGHTDDSGSKRRNKELSQQRADAVRRALVKRGVDARKLESKGYGPEVPIADNTTDAGKAKNRRVQFKILDMKKEEKKEEKSEEKKP